MTDVSPSDDDLVSSYLDHEATPEEVARVEADPRLMARVGEVRAAIAFVTTPPRLPEADLDRLRAAAVEAMAPVAAPVTDLAAARAKRLERRNRILSVAAGLLLFGGIVAGIASIDSSDDDSAGDASDTAATDDAAEAAVEVDADESAFSALGDADAGTNTDEMAEAEMATDGAMDSAAEPAADSASEDSADEDSGDDASADDGEEGPPVSRLSMTPAFDPLPDDLGGYGSVDELAAAIHDLVSAVITDEESDFAPEEFLAFTTCGETLAVALAGDEGLEIDIAEANVDTVHYTVVVGRQVDTGEIVGRIAPSDTCSPATELYPAP